MDQTSGFFLGLLIAGLIGFISTFIVRSWNTIERTRRQMFVTPPQPSLRALPTVPATSSVAVIPNTSPMDVLLSGCGTIFIRLIIQIGLFIAILVIFWFLLGEEIPSGFFGGVLFAAVLGFLLSRIYYNYIIIVRLFNFITNPPVPILNPANPPNRQYLAARPALPPFTLVITNSFEIAWRLVWMLILFYLLYLSFSTVFSYLSGELRFLAAPGFEV
jgi:hypothetical protein